MTTLLPILLLGLAGLFVGGAVSMYRQGARGPVIVLGLLAAVSATAGVLWLET
jgi:hypothetical protein